MHAQTDKIQIKYIEELSSNVQLKINMTEEVRA